MTKIAVIIPAYNEERVIRDCLNALVTQNFSDYTVHFIDDASTDSTAEIIRDYEKKFPQKIELHQLGKVGPGKARNLIAEKVKSPILAFTDADCAPDREWLSSLDEAFTQHPGATSVGGPQFAMLSSNPFQNKVEKFFKLTSILTDFYKSSSGDIRPTPHNPLCNVAYKRDVFLEMKGFRVDFFPGEDIEFDVRLGKTGRQILFHPKARVFHHRPETIEQFRKVMRSYGLAQGHLIREHGITRAIQWAGITALAAALSFPLLAWAIGGLVPFIMTAAAMIILALFRPSGESYFSLFLNSFNWLNGFAKGLCFSKVKAKFS